jgi:hypothetical protein
MLIDRALLEAYSRGEITRREIQDRIGEAVSFGVLLGELHQNGLPLPRVPSDPDSPGRRLLRDLLLRAQPHGG